MMVNKSSIIHRQRAVIAALTFSSHNQVGQYLFFGGCCRYTFPTMKFQLNEVYRTVEATKDPVGITEHQANNLLNRFQSFTLF